MGAEVWIFLGVIVTTIGVIAAAYFAYKGQKYSKPTGNGFAAEIKAALAELKEQMHRQDERLAVHRDEPTRPPSRPRIQPRLRRNHVCHP